MKFAYCRDETLQKQLECDENGDLKTNNNVIFILINQNEYSDPKVQKL